MGFYLNKITINNLRKQMNISVLFILSFGILLCVSTNGLAPNVNRQGSARDDDVNYQYFRRVALRQRNACSQFCEPTPAICLEFYPKDVVKNPAGLNTFARCHQCVYWKMCNFDYPHGPVLYGT